ncbi:hypothetical protein CD798_03545 [Bacillaceae bacterium SAOS 7]|nr:hypothetical protein CD798_03545 [Bacillaceae bacterium SAOS 7]
MTPIFFEFFVAGSMIAAPFYEKRYFSNYIIYWFGGGLDKRRMILQKSVVDSVKVLCDSANRPRD